MTGAAFYLPLDKGALSPSEAELSARLRVPLGYRDEAIAEAERELLALCRPAACAVRVPITREGEGLLLGGCEAEGEAIGKALQDCDEAFLLAVTLGMECERHLCKLSLLSPAKHFLADALASAYAEAAADLANEQLAEGLSLTNRFSPGYGDLPLSFQKSLLILTEANKYLHIELKDSLLMLPQKSITAIIGIRK